MMDFKEHIISHRKEKNTSIYCIDMKGKRVEDLAEYPGYIKLIENKGVYWTPNQDGTYNLNLYHEPSRYLTEI